MTEVLDQADDVRSDAALIAAVRHGDTDAYGVLYRRHLYAAKRAASCLASTAAEREDLVAEAFTRVLRVLRSGRGPNDEFRPYLLVTMRNTAINSTRRGPTHSLYAEVPDSYLQPVIDDPTAGGSHTSAVAVAFARLPERWRMILWHTEIEGENPADIAPLLGMTPNGVAALAYRAREGLRQAYLRLHLPTVHRRECRATADKLAGWVRRSVSQPQMRKINAHLDRCDRCRDLASTLARVNKDLPAALVPLVLGTPLAVYLAPTAVSAAAITAAANSGTAGLSILSAAQAAITTTAGKIGIAAAIAAVTAVTAVSSQPDTPPDGASDSVSVPTPGRERLPGQELVTSDRTSLSPSEAAEDADLDTDSDAVTTTKAQPGGTVKPALPSIGREPTQPPVPPRPTVTTRPTVEQPAAVVPTQPALSQTDLRRSTEQR